jgi:2-dehydropantoate 2-reductase
MPVIERVAILGAGAMGAYFAARFSSAGGFATALIARGERHERLKRDGLFVNGEAYRIPVVHPDRVDAPAALILVALKGYQLPGAAGDLQNLVGASTTILSVMNGLDSEEILAGLYGREKVLYAMSLGIDAVREGNRVTYSKPGVHYFGEATNTQLSERVRRVQAAFDRAGIAYETPPDMIRMLWWKFMINVGVNLPSAVMRATYGVFQTSPDAQALTEALMYEVIAVAEAAGVNLVDQDVRDWYPVLHTLSPEGKTSMLQDIEAGRKTEIDTFAGKVVELGQRHGIPTPVNQTMLRLIRVLERYPAGS